MKNFGIKSIAVLALLGQIDGNRAAELSQVNQQASNTTKLIDASPKPTEVVKDKTNEQK